MKNLRKRLACLLLSALLLIGCLPVTALGAENGFILVAEAGGKLVIAPEYISCTAGQTAAQALSASGHTFTGLDTGMISAIDGVTGNFTRSDENGGYDLSVSAASIGYLRFSEDMDSKPSDGLKQLMTAMADYTAHGGKSRGSALYTDLTGGVKAFAQLPDTFTFALDETEAPLIQELWFADGTCRTGWRAPRPIPEDDDFFENVWRSYRETGNID